MSEKQTTARIAFLGTGTMGAPMATRLARASNYVAAWNRTAEKAAALAGDGVSPEPTPAAAAHDADVLVTMLSDGAAVEAALTGPDGALSTLPKGSVWIQMSTVGVPAAERLGDLAAAHGVTYVDAPVLGSREPAESGELVVLASGPDEARGRCEPIFSAVGRRTVWLGAAGAGSRLKVVVNAWLMAMTATLGETIALAEALDVEPESFMDIIDRGAVAALYTDLNGTSMVTRDFPLRFPLEHALKDAELALEAAGEGQPLPVFEGTRADFARAVELGHGTRDWAAVVYAALAG